MLDYKKGGARKDAAFFIAEIGQGGTDNESVNSSVAMKKPVKAADGVLLILFAVKVITAFEGVEFRRTGFNAQTFGQCSPSFLLSYHPPGQSLIVFKSFEKWCLTRPSLVLILYRVEGISSSIFQKPLAEKTGGTMPKDNVLHALIFVQNWGEEGGLMEFLRGNPHAISIFHVMGRYSYIIDSNFDDKVQLNDWIDQLKTVKLPAGVPAVISMQTQKVIDVFKQKGNFGLKDYQDLSDPYHFFMLIDNPHHDEKLIELLKKMRIVHSILHIQGASSFIVEVITESYDSYKKLLAKTKTLKSIQHIETLEVLSVKKYRSQVMDKGGKLSYPQTDIRELYTL